MKLILVRHAQSKANARGIMQGQKIDWTLSELGRKQAKAVADYLKKEKIEAIYSSDLKRAKHTADEIAKHHKVNIILDKKLREANHGKENIEHLIKRAKFILNKVKKQNGTVIAVTHGGIGLTIMAVSTGNRKKGGELVKKTRLENASINIIHHNPKKNKWKIHTINKVVHKRCK